MTDIEYSRNDRSISELDLDRFDRVASLATRRCLVSDRHGQGLSVLIERGVASRVARSASRNQETERLWRWSE